MSSEKKTNIPTSEKDTLKELEETKLENVINKINNDNKKNLLNSNSDTITQDNKKESSNNCCGGDGQCQCNKDKGKGKEKEKEIEGTEEKKEEVGEVKIHDIPKRGKKRPLRTPKENFEHDIITRYRSKLWKKFRKALQDFQLVEPGDKVAVAISGGKDSLLMAKLFEEIQKHGDFYFDIVYLSMDPGFAPENKKILTDNCKTLGIDVKIEESDVFEVANKMSPNQPCFMCAKMRRGFLYRKAKEYGCNKLALGHHFDDVIETTLINIFYAGSYKTMVPKVNSENYEGLTLIRPMVYIREEDIRSIMKDNDITCMTCGCAVASSKLPSTRRNVKQLIGELKEKYGIKEQNIFRSAANVNLNGIYGYKDDQERFDYNDIYKRGKRQ